MAWNRIQAARLLSGKEMELFEASLADKAPQMSDKELGGHIRRVRTQRDKFQDLLRRQRVSSRERTGVKSGKSGVANARTGQKVQVFSEALARLEKQQAQRERSAERQAARPAAGGTARTSLRAAVRSAVEAKAGAGTSGRPSAGGSRKGGARSGSRSGPSAAAQSPPEVPNAKRAQAMGQARPLAHVASRGRRQQARRDAR